MSSPNKRDERDPSASERYDPSVDPARVARTIGSPAEGPLLKGRELASPSGVPSESSAMATDSAPAASSASPVTSSKRSSVARCSKCSKRVGLLGFACKCGGNFCSSCRQPEDHQCSADFRTEARERLSATLEKVAPSKIQRL